ncbi:MAG: microcin C ABC transporter permease YejB [Alphaproteobacteria bacterium]
MLRYILNRLLLMIPTLFGIMFLNFIIIQFAPGGPIQQIIIKLKGQGGDLEMRLAGGGDMLTSIDPSSEGIHDESVQGVDPEFIKQLEKQFGFDRPIHERFIKMMKSYICFDFGKSYFRDENVMAIILSKLPVSLSLGFWTILLVYFISIPLGIKKAVKDDSIFDLWTSVLIIIAYAVPSFLFALFLIILFAGGTSYNIFPLRGLFSDNFDALNWYQKIKDYMWHITLPITAMTIAGFAKLTLLTKNSFLEEIGKQYVLTARAKGGSEKHVLYKHVFKNACLIIIAGFPAAFVHIFFTSSLLIEVIFSLDGLGLLGFESAMSRDYPVMFGTLYIYTLFGMMIHLIGDILYVITDRRVDFHSSEF